ncbi:acetyl-CoA carboxylase carboxyltransferase subunit alpha [Bacteroidetes bacterium endosymbiont of Geopemphigus sp.]|uniref:acetyl-CoA carboxylase carboxyltransferase subunit alpha n=1 Tax=Bacteroidetes bacterium endosymbiont of Geopemphigus sp. TaxID=2047937 RepID=UPI000CD31B7A|nr:acetyl-CoA carboxylase carboxyltransferase subunit alpha [Bacteroidetes bacterium endosymbiont of Geopemphigus sp.]
MNYLDFEKPIQDLREQYDKCVILGRESGVDTSKTLAQLQLKLEKTTARIHKNLSPWQRVQLSRHPNRPYTLDYIQALTRGHFIELHGDRYAGDDKAVVGGFGKIDGESFMLIGTQKGKNTKDRQYRRFGMPNPEGYRKALRLMKLAEKFEKPIVTFIDTPGAYPGLEAEERGQGEAIGRNIYEMMRLSVPVIVIVIGEGASGGALGIGVGNSVCMMENTWYSVISPESCSTILWRSWEYKEKAAAALKLTATDMLKQKLIDDIIKEPSGGVHFHPEEAYKKVKRYILKAAKELSRLTSEELIIKRQDKYLAMGIFDD